MSAVHQLSRDDLITILTEPRNALVKQFQRFFQFDGIELVFSDDALVSVADKALERETGARGLRSIIEEILLEVQFELPSRRDVKKCVVTKETIERGQAADARHRGRARGRPGPRRRVGLAASAQPQDRFELRDVLDVLGRPAACFIAIRSSTDATSTAKPPRSKRSARRRSAA